MPIILVLFFAFAQCSAPVDAHDPARSDHQPAAASQPDVALADRIDQIIDAAHLGPERSLANDWEFLRRIYLDLVGRGPSLEELRLFMAQLQAAPNSKTAVRWQLIDDLLDRHEFSQHYAKVLEVMFSERREGSMFPFRDQIRQWLEDRRPLNELCLEVLASDGTAGDLPAGASFFINRGADPHQVTRDVSRIFLGRDIQCAQCHDHPLITDYEQSEYYGIFIFLNRTYVFIDENRGQQESLGEKGEGTVDFHSVFDPGATVSTAEPILPSGMGIDGEPDFIDSLDAYVISPANDRKAVPRYSRRQQLAVLATHPENDAFNRNLANRLWANLMGQGVVHPVDMHHSGNPPVSAQLLRVLAEELVSSRYDLREFLRQVTRSNAYQRSAMVPNLEAWEGPVGSGDALDGRILELQQERERLIPEKRRLDQEMAAAMQQVQRARADVRLLQKQVEDARRAVAASATGRDQEREKLSLLQDQQQRQQQLIESLESVLAKLDLTLTLVAQDDDLVEQRALVDRRLSATREVHAALDQALRDQQETLAAAEQSVLNQRNRVLAVANRHLALGEFVAEARGVQRRLQRERQRVQDADSDCQEQLGRMIAIKDWLDSKEQWIRASESGDATAADHLRAALDHQQADLLDSWRRSFAIRQVRGLSPEQMAGSIYVALGMDRPVRDKARLDWQTNRSDSAGEVETEGRSRQISIDRAVAGHMWGVLEKMIMRRFSSPAGTPQDGFFATVDHALMLQNDPIVQSWLKPSDEGLIRQLIDCESVDELADQMYLSVLARPADIDEKQMVAKLLAQHSAERDAVICELVWGLLASAEFRFIL